VRRGVASKTCGAGFIGCVSNQMPWKPLAHTYLWQNVPRGLRREVLFRVTARLAPRPTPDAGGGSPIIVAGFLRTASGLGEGARLCYEALSRCGQDVYGIDLTEFFGQPGPVVPFSFRDGRSIKRAGSLVLHVNGPFVPLALMRLGRRLVRGKKIIGYWAWELSSVPNEWQVGVPFVHEIWVPSEFTAGAMEVIAGEVPVRVVPHPVAARGAPAVQARRRGKGPFTALVIFNMASGFARKNPLAAIGAFREAFDNDPTCQLIVRVVNANLYPGGHEALKAAVASNSNIRISEAESSEPSVYELYRSADVVLSLHRSEGFGLVIAEAMLHGLPVIATNWSGNVDFLTADNGLPISYSLVPAVDPQGTYDQPTLLWAEADIDDAAAKLRMLRDDPDKAVGLRNKAANDAASAFRAEVYGKTVNEALCF
jgi:glycosyltransferase involved in cell wall biosynthesis